MAALEVPLEIVQIFKEGRISLRERLGQSTAVEQEE
jgi:hypothetical protein